MGKRSSASAFVVAATVVAAIAGCGGGSAARVAASPTPSPLVALVGRAFGDTASFGLHIVALDRVSEHALIAARNTKNLIVLAVIPGREIEVIMPGGTALRREREDGHFTVDLRRIDDGIRPPDANEDAAARLAYERCMAQVAATQRRIEQQRRAVRRDSTGAVIPDERRGSNAGADQSAMQKSCDRMAMRSPAKGPIRYLAARAPADRYLMVLNSSSKIPLEQLYERLAVLTAVAPDVATTIEAIAAGLYVGVEGSWGGTFVAW
ncbi:MAG: hypothetical protein ABMA00_05000 [Gemmatimonas sp.]